MKITEELCSRILVALEEGKADDVVMLDLRGKHSIFAYMIIASSKTERHSMALVEDALEASKGITVPGTVTIEGTDTKNWISVDFGEIALQVFLPEVRQYYNIEGAWPIKKDS